MLRGSKCTIIYSQRGLQNHKSFTGMGLMSTISIMHSAPIQCSIWSPSTVIPKSSPSRAQVNWVLRLYYPHWECGSGGSQHHFELDRRTTLNIALVCLHLDFLCKRHACLFVAERCTAFLTNFMDTNAQFKYNDMLVRDNNNWTTLKFILLTQCAH